MSTKIYNGYHIDFPSLAALSRRLRDFGARARETANRLAAQRAATLAVELLDLAAVDHPHHELLDARSGAARQSFVEAAAYVSDRWRKCQASPQRDPPYDFRATVAIVPRRSNALAIFYGDQDPMERAWADTPGVTPFPYWDNTDRPENVTAREWRQRRDAWERALRNAPPSHSALTVEAVSTCDVDHPRLTSILGEARKIRWRDRVTAVAGTLVDADWSARERPTTYVGAMRWLTDEGRRTAIAAKRPVVAERLKRRITEADLRQVVFPELTREQRKAS